jgi:aspartate aminotransferase
MELAQRLAPIKPSPTLAMDARAKEMRRQGLDVIGFAAGEPDFRTPDHICLAAIKAIVDGAHGYTAADGLPELKAAIIRKFQRDAGLTYAPDEVVATCGGKHALYNLAQATLNPGDEIIIPGPYWVSYPDIALLAGAKPVILPTERTSGFKISPAQLQAALTPRTKAVIINSPSNPTGAVYSKSELLALTEVLLDRDLLIWSDEIYEHLIFSAEPFACVAGLKPELKEKVAVLSGVSKTYAMTGWRIGYLAGPKAVARAVAKVQSQSTSNPATVAQLAAVAALDGPQECVAAMKAAFNRRRRLFMDLLKDLKVVCDPPQGAFYVFPDFSAYLGGRVKDSAELSEYLLDKAHLATVPGSAFGAEGYVRFSYAISDAQIKAGLERLKKALEIGRAHV